jgi:hypothetical protein
VLGEIDMPKSNYLARIELHNSDELYDELHKAMKKIKYLLEINVTSGKPPLMHKAEMPHATYLAVKDSSLNVETKLIHTTIKEALKLPVRTPKHTEKAKTFSYLVGKIEGTLLCGGLKPVPVKK